MANKKQHSEEIQRLLKQVVQHFQDEDISVRQRQIRTWRSLKLLWEGFRNTYYSEVAHDWRIPDSASSSEDTDQSYYDKPINVFRAYLESIIAALSITVPGIKCFPDDADNSLDLMTARAGDKIGKQIYRHNDVALQWLHAWFIFCTEGVVAANIYPEDKEEYGQYKENSYEEVTEYHDQVTCPECGYEIEDNEVEEGAPEGYMEQGMEGGMEICPSCGTPINPQVQRMVMNVSKLVRTELKNKTRIKMRTRGGLYVKIPTYAREQCDCPYLSYSYETHYVNAISKYPNLREDLQGKPQGIYDPYESWGRLSPQYLGEYPENNVTCREWWLRPVAFDILPEEEANKLHKLFPEGARVDLVNDMFAEAYPEKLDERWKLTYNPMSDYLQHDPLGLLLVSVQEITNDLISLVLQTIEHGIGQTFGDPKVLNFDAYKQMETVPGGIYPATPRAGKGLGEGFFELKTATLSQETLPFADNIQQLGQLVSGALPSLFGGALQEQKTASGYAMSREQALQRLQNLWKMFTTWWKQIYEEAIPLYIANVKEDERDVQLDPNGNFINTFIRKSELEGKIGKFELESNENLPLTWSQRKEVVFNLIQTNNPELLAILGAPENLPIIREALGLDDFFVPGEDDRNKQYEEIKLLMDSEPLLMPPEQDPMTGMMGMPMEVPSIEIDPDIDNHELEFEICRSWLVSDAGRLAKIENNPGYNNVLLHAKAHLQVMQQQQMMQQMAMAQSQEGAPGDKKPKESSKPAPIMENGDVNLT